MHSILDKIWYIVKTFCEITGKSNKDLASLGEASQIKALPPVLTMATLRGTTQIGLFLFVSLCPRWPSQVSLTISRFNIANVNGSIVHL